MSCEYDDSRFDFAPSVRVQHEESGAINRFTADFKDITVPTVVRAVERATTIAKATGRFVLSAAGIALEGFSDRIENVTDKARKEKDMFKSVVRHFNAGRPRRHG